MINADHTELITITHFNGVQAKIQGISAFVQWEFYGSVCGNLFDMSSCVCFDLMCVTYQILKHNKSTRFMKCSLNIWYQNIGKKEHEKLEEYQGLREQLSSLPHPHVGSEDIGGPSRCQE